MNEYSLTIMARAIDETKIERIRKATVEMIVEHGFGGASISVIARQAGVAEGYLYRYYNGKNELVNDLLHTNLNELISKLDELLNDLHSAGEIFEQLIRELFRIAKKSPERIKFLFVLMHDYNFTFQESQRKRITDLCKKVRDKGVATGEISSEIDEESIYLLGFTYPIEFVNLRFKKTFKRSTLGEKEIQKVLRVCLNAIK
jgi:TetR/AcrR family transcriptional regulator, repressor of fatR-cypB operon